MSPLVERVAIDVHLPAGTAGPDPLDFDVRSFLVPPRLPKSRRIGRTPSPVSTRAAPSRIS